MRKNFWLPLLAMIMTQACTYLHKSYHHFELRGSLPNVECISTGKMQLKIEANKVSHNKIKAEEGLCTLIPILPLLPNFSSPSKRRENDDKLRQQKQKALRIYNANEI